MNYPNYYQQYPQQVYQPNTPQIQNGGFISAASIEYARNYPVAPGNVVTFKIENQPIVCEKSQGFSQLEGPVFNIYRLVKEDALAELEPKAEYLSLADIQPILNDFNDELTTLKDEINYLKERANKKASYGKKEDKE